MGTAESGTWKLLMYPLIIIVVIGVVLSLILTPFADNQITQASTTPEAVNFFNNVTNGGVVGNFTIPLFIADFTFDIRSPTYLLPQFMREFFVNQMVIILDIPLWLLIPTIVVFTAGLIYVAYDSFTKLIP